MAKMMNLEESLEEFFDSDISADEEEETVENVVFNSSGDAEVENELYGKEINVVGLMKEFKNSNYFKKLEFDWWNQIETMDTAQETYNIVCQESYYREKNGLPEKSAIEKYATKLLAMFMCIDYNERDQVEAELEKFLDQLRECGYSGPGTCLDIEIDNTIDHPDCIDGEPHSDEKSNDSEDVDHDNESLAVDGDLGEDCGDPKNVDSVSEDVDHGDESRDVDCDLGEDWGDPVDSVQFEHPEDEDSVFDDPFPFKPEDQFDYDVLVNLYALNRETFETGSSCFSGIQSEKENFEMISELMETKKEVFEKAFGPKEKKKSGTDKETGTMEKSENQAGPMEKENPATKEKEQSEKEAGTLEKEKSENTAGDDDEKGKSDNPAAGPDQKEKSENTAGPDENKNANDWENTEHIRVRLIQEDKVGPGKALDFASVAASALSTMNSPNWWKCFIRKDHCDACRKDLVSHLEKIKLDHRKLFAIKWNIVPDEYKAILPKYKQYCPCYELTLCTDPDSDGQSCKTRAEEALAKILDCFEKQPNSKHSKLDVTNRPKDVDPSSTKKTKCDCLSRVGYEHNKNAKNTIVDIDDLEEGHDCCCLFCQREVLIDAIQTEHPLEINKFSLSEVGNPANHCGIAEVPEPGDLTIYRPPDESVLSDQQKLVLEWYNEQYEHNWPDVFMNSCAVVYRKYLKIKQAHWLFHKCHNCGWCNCYEMSKQMKNHTFY